MALELFGTSGCHLCEAAEAYVAEALRRVPITFELALIEIADDPDLMEAFGLQIPVLRCDERQLNWPFTANDVVLFLSADHAEPHHL
ncbi:MAG: hypothetical protein RL333_221 [Pseudomonadota bacterium]